MKSLFLYFLTQHKKQYLHPIIDIKKKKVLFYEMLARIDINNNLYIPLQFMDNMTDNERTILALNNLNSLSSLQKKYPNDFFSLNVSTIEFKLGFENHLRQAIINKEIDPNRCVLEITENNSIEKDDIQLFKKLKKDYNIRFALDDFGSKYSNFYQIDLLDGLFDYIKLDGSFVKDIDKDERKKIIFLRFTEMLNLYNKEIIAEYISKKEIFQLVYNSNIHLLQGFFFIEPKEAELCIYETNKIINNL